jgi:hypothetical protein
MGIVVIVSVEMKEFTMKVIKLIFAGLLGFMLLGRGSIFHVSFSRRKMVGK